MTADTQVQPGWYPDPLGLPQMRWWDGHAWTEHTSDARRPLIPQTVTTAASAPTPAPAPTITISVPPVTSAVPPSPLPAEVPPAPKPAPRVVHEGPAALPAGTATSPELGWAGAALTLHSVQVARVPMVIELEVTGHPVVTIDTRFQAFDWQLELDRFPANPAGVRVSIDLVDMDTPPSFELPGQSLDMLLWKIGQVAFTDRLAPWLHAGERYRLERWPNVTSLQPDMDEIRQTAMLANGAFTIDELARTSGRSSESVRRLINTLSLVGVLSVAAPDVAPPVVVTAPPAADYLQAREGGLFRKLRDRLGI